jgi:hypothetical protein
MRNPIPYPLRAAKISIELNPFGFWWKPSFFRKKYISERAKADGNAIWWARWAWFQISYSRWM